jgi:glycosyltransferase involved in cell wall biosynthesis
VAECISSALNQSFQDFEIVITDDASTDATVKVIEEFKDPRIRLFRHVKNLGPSIAANNNMRQARGEYLAFLPSDDAFLPLKLERQVAFLDDNPSFAVAFGLVEVVDENGAPFVDKDHFYFRVFDQRNRTRTEWLRYFFLNGNCLCGTTAMARRSLWNEIGEHDPRLLQLQDFDYWIRVCFRYDIHIIQEPLVRYRIRANGLNASGIRPVSQTRSTWEFPKVLRHYLRLEERQSFFEVFPEAAQIEASAEAPISYLLARVALSSDHLATQAFGLDLLFELLERPDSAALLHRIGFDYTQFLKLTGDRDLYNLHRIAYYQEKLALLSLEMDAIIKSISWKITKPLRVASRGWRLFAPVQWYEKQRKRLRKLMIIV